VREALGLPSTVECGIFDRDGDGRVTIAELIVAVRAAVNGCASFGF
jgi:hypothetical protein